MKTLKLDFINAKSYIIGLVSEAKVKIMKIIINTKTTISGIDLHWNYQKHISIHFWVIY